MSANGKQLDPDAVRRPFEPSVTGAETEPSTRDACLENRACPFCEFLAPGAWIRCWRCCRHSKSAVVTTGPPLSLKSTAARHIERFLGMTRIEADRLGWVGSLAGGNDPERSARRAERVYMQASVPLQCGYPVVFDGCVRRRSNREGLLARIAADFPGTRVIYLYCRAERADVRRLRLLARARGSDAMGSEPLSEETANELLRTFEEPFEDVDPATGKRVPVVFFNTDIFEVTIHNVSADPEVQVLMTKIRDLLFNAVHTGRL